MRYGLFLWFMDGFSLAGDRFHLFLELFLIEQIIGTDKLHAVVEFEDERHPGRNVDVHDLLFADVGQIHEKGAQRIAVCCDQNVLSSFDMRSDFLFIKRNDPFDGCFQAFAKRQIGRASCRERV